MVDVINLDGDVARNNVGNLHQSAGELPDAQTIGNVDGNRTEPASADYTTRLEEASTRLGSGIERLRQFVANNADALNNAVNTLRDTDRMTADAADKATALIDDVVAGPATTSGSAQSRSQNAFR